MEIYRSSIILVIVATIVVPATVAQSNFDYSQEPIPTPFLLDDSYPNRPETDVCRPIFDHILRDSARFTNELVLNTNPQITFATSDSRRMTSRMQTRLDRLRQSYNGQFTVLKTWTQYPDSEVPDNTSLHYEGEGGKGYLRMHVCVCVHFLNMSLCAHEYAQEAWKQCSEMLFVYQISVHACTDDPISTCLL